MQFRIQAPVAMVTRSLKTGISKALVQVFWTCCWNDNKSILILFIKRKRSKLRNKCCRGSGAKSSNSGTGPRTISGTDLVKPQGEMLYCRSNVLFSLSLNSSMGFYGNGLVCIWDTVRHSRMLRWSQRRYFARRFDVRQNNSDHPCQLSYFFFSSSLTSEASFFLTFILYYDLIFPLLLFS